MLGEEGQIHYVSKLKNYNYYKSVKGQNFFRGRERIGSSGLSAVLGPAFKLGVV